MTPKRSLLDYLAEHAARQPERAAIRCGPRTVTWRELEAAAARCRGALAARGIGAGERVALAMSESPEAIVALLGVMSAGAVAVPCNTLLPVEGLAHVLADSGAKLVIASPEHRAHAQAAGAAALASMEELLAAAAAPPARFDAATPCLVVYTSGSTGQPKGAVHTHGHLPCAAESVGRLLGLGPDDRIFSAPRLHFAYGLGNSLSLPLGAGACALLLPERPTPARVAELLQASRPTVLFGVPTFYRLLIEHARAGHRLDTASLRLCSSAGEVLPLSTAQEWKALTGLEILESIGTTELLYAFMHNTPAAHRPGSSGRVLEGYECRLTRPDGSAVEGEGRGDLHVRGPSVFTHYLNQPERTAAVLREGWVRTGDVFRRDAEGFYWFEGRSDDLFKCSGLWVSPAEVEEAVARHAAVLEVGVIAEADAGGATVPAAYVTLRPGAAATEGEIIAEAAKTLPRFKQPRRVHFVAELPRTATGKLQRYKLRERARERPCSSSRG